MIYINLVFEDELSEAVMAQILHCFDNKYQINESYSEGGFGYIRRNIRGFNEAARYNPYFILTDLDNYQCPIALLNDWISFDLNRSCILRIAVKEVEAWLLADSEGFSSHFAISRALMPRDPEELPDPKSALINLAKKSRRRSIREAIVPINENAQIGPDYNSKLIDFVVNHWNIQDSVKNSDSLRKAYHKLLNFGS